MNAIIEGKNLSRFYGIILGLNNVSFRILPGITGIIGANGSGKTTLFRLLTGQVKPSSGSITVFGLNPWNNTAVQSRLAYCPEAEAVPAHLTAYDWLVGLGMLSGLSSRNAKQRAETTLQQVQLPAEHWEKLLTSLSKGMRQRVKLAQCLLHEPQLIILDEPMNGLDPMGREDFASVLRALASEGRSVLISSHILDDLEALCSGFLHLRSGRIPASLNEQPTRDSPRWPDATTFRCAAPARLARFFFEQDLLRGCDVIPEIGTLHARWNSAARFFENFHQILLSSGIPIYEVQTTGSSFDKTLDPVLKP